jgi:hypothetical protein
MDLTVPGDTLNTDNLMAFTKGNPSDGNVNTMVTLLRRLDLKHAD